MANSAQAIKRVRQNNGRSTENQKHVSKMRTAIKNFNQAVENDADNKTELLQEAHRLLDRAANHGLIHKNKANRTKSALASKLNG